MIAACDAELLGKKFEDRRLKIEVSDFYKGELVSEDDLRKMLADVTIGNFVGGRTIGVCISLGLVSRKNVIKIGSVEHAQCTFI